MSRSFVGRALTERYYLSHRRLMLSLAYLVRAVWKSLGIDGGRNKPGVVSVLLDRLVELIEYFHELSLALTHDYFVTFSLVDYPERLLSPLVDDKGEPHRARWGAMDVRVADELEDLAEPILRGRIAEVPGATEAIVDDKAYAEVHDVDAYPRVAEVMGAEFAGGLVEDSDAPGVVDDERAGVPEPQRRDPIVVVPDPNPVSDGNARTRLQIKGPDNLERQTAALHDAEYLDADERERRIQDKSDKSWVRTANAATTLADAGVDFVEAAAASQAMGVVRVLGPNPCSFCVMLAALGVVYEQGAWDSANAKFRKHVSSTGKVMHGGNAKVHDGCQCRLEPVPVGIEEDDLPPGVERARALWRMGTSKMPDGYTWSEQYKNFRRMFRDGKIVEKDWQFERPMLISKRDELRLKIPAMMMHLAFLEQYENARPHKLEFYRSQLEYSLQQWEKYGFGETDWTREYEWMVERSASAVYPDEIRKRHLAEAVRLYPEARAELERNEALQSWLVAQYPNADKDKFWPDDRLEPKPMPEFE